jgi:2',3'-cyclic-nucleotide 2'-phosphodiesterase (5'-nucleotidase family)
MGPTAMNFLPRPLTVRTCLTGLYVAVLFVHCASDQNKTGDDRVVATVLTTSSIRGQLIPSGNDKYLRGSFARRAALINDERSKGRPALVVDGGNLGVPNEERERDPAGKNAFLWELMGSLGYDAVTPGDLELLHGLESIKKLYARSPGIQVVSANIRDASGDRIWPPYAVIKKDGFRFGVTGVTDPSFYAFNLRRGVQEKDEFTFLEPIAALSAVLPELEARSDCTVILLHMGPRDAEDVGLKLTRPGVIVLGHNPGFRAWGQHVGNAWILRTGNGGDAIGVLELGRKADTLYAIRNEGVGLLEEMPEDPEIARLVREYMESTR